jgi:hypothetical protein
MENGIWISEGGSFRTMRTCRHHGLQEFSYHLKAHKNVYWVCLECNNQRNRKSDVPKWRCSPETRAKRTAAMIGNNHLLGYEHGPGSLIKMVESMKGANCDNTREKASNWKGGLSFEPYCPKFNADLKRRIRAFFGHRCVVCGKGVEENGKRKQLMACHHVEYNKSACCDGKPVHFAALCVTCHSITGKNRCRWEAMLHRIIDEIYDGKSYFTKEEWSKRVD